MDKHGSTHDWPRGGGPLWLHPDDDLAPNRPGEHLHAILASTRDAHGPRRRAPHALAARLARRTGPAAEWRGQLAGHQQVGDALEAMAPGGWRALHSIPLPSHSVIAHLLVGPGGVFTIRTAHHRRARIRVGDDMVRVGRRRCEPYVRLVRREARSAALALSRGCGFPVDTQPVLVFVAASRLTPHPGAGSVRVLRERDVHRLGAGSAVWKPAEVETVYAVARDRRTWTGL
ncbi:nuclease-related domain-containing protein [Streptomyces boncukensis]|uniref:NERD domain-containing protein n=1 Tax=Streptomyces boncukensis TaxID=2711219 RepID=A0A6G4WX77_9ACTN|nr:nuclease-related domain-containing protein [Streptomyces boncukensis]NGO69613.1 NERD domain-containing protein [Streptomyces boncukensis]